MTKSVAELTEQAKQIAESLKPKSIDLNKIKTSKDMLVVLKFFLSNIQYTITDKAKNYEQIKKYLDN